MPLYRGFRRSSWSHTRRGQPLRASLPTWAFYLRAASKRQPLTLMGILPHHSWHCTKSLCGSSSLFPQLRSWPPFGEIGVGRGCGRGFRIACDDIATCKPTLKIRQATSGGTEGSVRIFSPGRAPPTHRAAHGTSVLAHEDAPTTVVRICWRIASLALMSSSIMALAWRWTFCLRRLRTIRPAMVFTPGISGSLMAAGRS